MKEKIYTVVFCRSCGKNVGEWTPAGLNKGERKHMEQTKNTHNGYEVRTVPKGYKGNLWKLRMLKI